MHMARMWVTEGCNAFCHYCLNARSREKHQMDTQHFTALCEYFKRNSFDKIAIMGGEPTIHPNFEEIMAISQKYFDIVYLFTNAINCSVLNLYKPRENDTIIYNFSFANNLNKKSFLLDYPGKRHLDIVIGNETDTEKITENILRVSSIDTTRIECNLVIDNCINIFKYKSLLIEKINEIYNNVRLQNPLVRIQFQSNLPLCFTYGEKLPPHTLNTICPNEAVLVDGEYNVRFCNLFSDKLVNMFKDDNLIPFKILRNYARAASIGLRKKSLEKVCKDCLFYGDQCNGKCYIPQDTILRDDILNNTKLPWLTL